MRSIRVFLFALVAICLLLAATAFALVVRQTNALSRQQVEAQAQETTRALSQAVDQELERAIGVMAALGASEAAQKQDWAAFDRQARAALRTKDSWIVVHDRRGQQFVNTRLPVGAPLPKAPPPRQMWEELANGKPRVCNLVHGAVEPNIVCVDAPIGTGSNPQYAVSMIFKPSAFGSIVTRAAGPGNIATLVDRSNRVIWRNVKPEQFVGREATGKMLEALRSGRPNGAMESKSLEGVDMLSAFNRSPVSGWSVIVGTPLNQIEAASREALWRGSLVALAVFLFGGALALLLGARLVSAVDALKTATASNTALEHPPKRTGITEIDAAAEALRASFAARAESERHQQMLVGELNHRVKNTLSIVQSLAHQTFRSGASPKEAIAAFESRLQALAAAHNLLTQERWEAAPIPQIVNAALRPFCDANRCRLDGPDLKVPPQTAVSLALAVHELATNAAKYGALATDAGTIDVRWTADDGEFNFLWRENGGPPVQAPKTEGFGMRLIKRGLASELRGAAQVEFDPDGVVCRLSGRLKPA